MPEREEKEYTTSNRRSEMGKSSIDITCGFCGATVTAYLWSLAGGGKKCPCGAKHTNYGYSVKTQ